MLKMAGFVNFSKMAVLGVDFGGIWGSGRLGVKYGQNGSKMAKMGGNSQNGHKKYRTWPKPKLKHKKIRVV